MNSVRRSARPALVAAMTGSVLLSGCFVQTMNRPPAPTAREELATTVTRASQEVLASRYGIADKLLADFALQHPATPEGAEASYWRALYKLDPANQTATPRDAAALLDAYLADATTAEHRAEATTLRRIATSLDRSAVASTAPATASPTPTTTTGTQAPAAPGAPAATPNDRARDEELQRLRDELAKANAELDRIRRRLAQPKP
jgi:TolA-binding protein